MDEIRYTIKTPMITCNTFSINRCMICFLNRSGDDTCLTFKIFHQPAWSGQPQIKKRKMKTRFVSPTKSAPGDSKTRYTHFFCSIVEFEGENWRCQNRRLSSFWPANWQVELNGTMKHRDIRTFKWENSFDLTNARQTNYYSSFHKLLMIRVWLT